MFNKVPCRQPHVPSLIRHNKRDPINALQDPSIKSFNCLLVHSVIYQRIYYIKSSAWPFQLFVMIFVILGLNKRNFARVISRQKSAFSLLCCVWPFGDFFRLSSPHAKIAKTSVLKIKVYEPRGIAKQVCPVASKSLTHAPMPVKEPSINYTLPCWSILQFSCAVMNILRTAEAQSPSSIDSVRSHMH